MAATAPAYRPQGWTSSTDFDLMDEQAQAELDADDDAAYAAEHATDREARARVADGQL